MFFELKPNGNVRNTAVYESDAAVVYFYEHGDVSNYDVRKVKRETSHARDLDVCNSYLWTSLTYK